MKSTQQRSLMDRFRFYRERNAAPLAYYFARKHHVAGEYAVPEWLVVWDCRGDDHGKGAI